ncbi:type I restriction enzyme HsdR N-terminal domain-containing protein [Lentilitoribacter sp. EG35]|uniref:type I restriction enzyme HsdR N-terminal domain-containing protein n=1 Tax=Lentilitoribacter sp. EG35 TaxID=3234192 RepID=UPI00345F5A80
MLQACENSETEGDVETKVVGPLLQEEIYLAIPKDFIKSKTYLSPRDIDKGGAKKFGYYPDFSIFINSLPICIIEAKSPQNSEDDAYREACLYAHEVNRAYPNNVNPCQLVIGTNGKSIKVGYWDSDPKLNVRVEDLLVGTKALQDLQELCSYSVLSSFANDVTAKLRLADFKRPFNQGEGSALINSKVGSNTFAADLNPILRRYFTSHSQQDDMEIFAHAYILSTEVTTHDRNLQAFLKDRLMRSSSAGRTELRPGKKT